jgi:hypothetical protein
MRESRISCHHEPLCRTGVIATEEGFVPAVKAEAGSGVSAPVLGSIVQADTLLLPTHHAGELG